MFSNFNEKSSTPEPSLSQPKQAAGDDQALLSHTAPVQVNIRVVLEYQWTDSRDLIADVTATQVSSKPGHVGISLKSVVDSLAAKGFELELEHRISYRDAEKSLYVYIGRTSDTSILDTFLLPDEAFTSTKEGGERTLTLLIREAGSSRSGQKQLPSARQHSFGQEPAKLHEEGLQQSAQFAKDTHALLASQSFKEEATGAAMIPDSVRIELRSKTMASRLTKDSAAQEAADQADLKRTKERQIRFVVERVSLWRKLYNGVELGNGETVRYSLEDSARLVSISKKSLDDYLLQLRFGRMYGFDFLKHQCDNIGVLRKFVREQKAKLKRQQQRKTSQEKADTLSRADSHQGLSEEPSKEESTHGITVERV